MTHFSFELDPHTVLGVGPKSSLQEIRDAYRQKAKKYHPDAGGEDWAFRILVQAYEMLSSARVVRATHAESRAQSPARPAAAARPQRRADAVHPGIHDRNVDPSHLVGLEHLCVRYLWDEGDYLWLTQRVPDEERFLSCSLNLMWPDPTWVDARSPDLNRSSIIARLQEAFDHTIINTRVVSTQSHVEDDRFEGWMSYSNFDRSWKAVNTIHEFLNERGLGLRQWSRDLFIPRTWRATH